MHSSLSVLLMWIVYLACMTCSLGQEAEDTTCRADVVRDGAINVEDLLYVLSSWHCSTGDEHTCGGTAGDTGPGMNADVTGPDGIPDGTVNTHDILFVLSKFRPGMLTQGGQGGHPAPLASRLYRIHTHFLLSLHGI